MEDAKVTVLLSKDVLEFLLVGFKFLGDFLGFLEEGALGRQLADDLLGRGQGADEAADFVFSIPQLVNF